MTWSEEEEEEEEEARFNKAEATSVRQTAASMEPGWGGL